jgi:hypothetical protein
MEWGVGVLQQKPSLYLQIQIMIQQLDLNSIYPSNKNCPR